MDNENLYWIWLAGRPGFGPVKLRQMLELCGGPRRLYEAEPGDLARMGLSERARRTLADKDLRPARAILQRCDESGVTLLSLREEVYPAALRQTPDAPLVLYCLGALPASGRQPWIGVVGAREADRRGLQTARALGWQLSDCGGVVVTGMAKGVDAEAAWGALEQGGAVVGVLGGGVDTVYPRENAALYERVKARGCLLSEYPPGTAPNGRHFPARNRIISALSDGVVVVQAAEHSGALITARWAADQGRDVFSVPGPAGDPLCRGSNQLLREGAILAESGWDIMREYVYRYPGAVRMSSQGSGVGPRASAEGETPCRGKPVGGAALDAPPENSQSCGDSAPPRAEIDVSALPPIQRQIVEALQGGPLQLDTLIDRLGLPAGQVLTQLTLLQVKKIISQKPGKVYQL